MSIKSFKRSSFPLFPFSDMLSSIRNTCLSVGWLVRLKTLLCAVKIFIFFWRHFQMKTTCIFSKLPLIPQELFEDSLQEQICISQIWRPGIWSNGCIFMLSSTEFWMSQVRHCNLTMNFMGAVCIHLWITWVYIYLIKSGMVNLLLFKQF